MVMWEYERLRHEAQNQKRDPGFSFIDAGELEEAAREAREMAERLKREERRDATWMLALIPLAVAVYFVVSVVVR